MLTLLVTLALIWLGLKALCFFVSLPFRFLAYMMTGPGAFIFWGFIIVMILGSL
jgi:hypothetical protein